jgi:Secretion system C-terminal sorting domain
MITKIYCCIIALLAFVQVQAQSPTTSPDSSYRQCGVTKSLRNAMKVPFDTGSRFALVPLVPGYPIAATEVCGRFALCYEDMRLGLLEGYNDPVFGPMRRDNLCRVIQYIESVLDLSLVPPGGINLLIDRSDRYATTPSVGLPFFRVPPGTHPIVDGFVADYIRTGIDPAPGTFHGMIGINFSPTIIGSTLTATNSNFSVTAACGIDLASMELHHLSHVLGMFSFVEENISGNYTTTPPATGPFTSLDTAVHTTPNPETIANPFMIGNLFPFISSGFSFTPSGIVSDRKFWINGKQPPYNHGVDKVNTATATWHFVGKGTTYGMQPRLSPGDYQDYVTLQYEVYSAAPMRRQWTKGELEMFTGTMRYSYNPTYASAHSAEIANHTPYSTKMGSNAYNFIYNSFEGPERLPADFILTNNIGSSLVIDLTTDGTLLDDDGDPISIFPGSLVNFRGCGEGGNNHNLLSVNGAGNQITYTPREDFYGRAQLGFNLFDGTERGAFVIYTIDVRKGTNVAIPAGDNIVLNGSFEEGAEVRVIGAGGSELINNSVNLSSDHAYRLGLHFADSHPYEFLKSGIGTVIVNNSNDNGLCVTTTNTIFGGVLMTFPAPWWVSPLPVVDMPNPPFIAERRYRGMGNPGLLMYLGENMQQCKRYALEFYARRTYTSGIVYPAKEEIKFGFTNDARMHGSTFAGSIENVDLTWSPTSLVPAKHAFTKGEWQKVKISFTYCDTTAANILYLDVHDWWGPLVEPGLSPAPLVLDSVSLKEVDFGVDIAITYPGGCERTLVANPGEIASYGCNSVLYTWTDLSGTVLGTGKELTVSAMVMKSYIVTADDGCGHTAADTIEVAPCRCAPGVVLGTPSFTTLSGTVPSTLAPGLYYAATDLTVSGTTTFNNAILLMEPNVAINVGNTAKLILDTTHIFTCPDTNRLWAGIRLQSSGSSSARIEIRNGSLIEDAYFAIDGKNLKVPSSGNIIDITNSTFNRNLVGISVNGAYTLGSAGTYPIKVQNSLFTARHFDTMAGYPFSWAPNVRLREELHTVSNTKAPYKISRDYAKAYLKNDTMAYMGIEFYNTGNTLVPGSSYAEVLIGEPNFFWNRNIIDNMQYGFHSNNSNTVLVNTHIINIGKRMVPDDNTDHSYATAEGMGIIGQSTGTRTNRIKVGAGANAGVKLYDCYSSIHMENVADVDIKAVAISSSHTLGDKTVPGSDRSTDWYSGTGITMIGNRNHLKWSITQDTISNINQGMYVYIGNPVVGATTEIKNNMLYDRNRSGRFTGLTALQYMLQGITVAGPGPSNKNTVTLTDNTLNGVFNAIQLNYLQSATATVANNTIDISDKTASTPGVPQYGINVLACIDATISANTVSTASLGSKVNAINIKGYYASYTNNLRLCGNFTNRIGSAFVFDGKSAQVGTRWIGNTINDGWRGMTLASDIGQQGFMYDWRTVPTSTFYGPILNKWNGFGGAKEQTVTIGYTNTMQSVLNVKNLPSGSAERPTINVSELLLPFPNLYDYLSSSRSIRVPNGPPSDANCHGALYEQQTTPRPELSGPFVTVKALGRLVMNDSLGYDSTYRVNQWCNQLAVYELGTVHPELRDSSGTLDTFMVRATPSRFGWLTAIGQAIGTGNIATAKSLMNAPVPAMGRVVVNCNITITDYPAANSIVSDYLAYYNTHIRMLEDTINSTDTAILGSIARKCPPVDGAVVYKARALYQLLTGIAVQYKDDSCAFGMGGHSLFRVAPEDVIAGSSVQDYTLFPNPNDGVFSIRQAIPSDKIVEAKIYNTLGQELHRETVQFRGGVLTFRLANAMPGLYLVCLTDENQKTVCLKFNVR